MAKKKTITDADGNVYVEATPFYKKPWFWVIIAVIVVIAFFAMIGSGNGDGNSSSTTAKSSKVAKGFSTKKDESSSSEKTISFDNGRKTIVAESDHAVSWSDSAWAGTTVSVDNAKIIQVKPFKDDGDGKAYQGIVQVHFNLKATRDISIYPAQATLITSDGQQADADQYDSDNFDGDIAKGVSSDGTVSFELPKMTDPSSIKTLRLKFSGNYDTDNYDDDNAYHDYDVTINL